MPVTENKKAPSLTLQNSTGQKIKLSDFLGQQVVLYFYPKDNTSGCTKEAIAFESLKDDFARLGVVIIGVSPDSGESHQKFAEKHGLNFTLLSDPDKKAMTRFEAFGEKTMYGKKRMGVIRSTLWIDDKGKVRKHWRRVAKAADHPAKVLDFIRANIGA